MPNRFVAVAMLLFSTSVAHAEPLGWNFTATLSAANGADYLLVGSQRYYVNDYHDEIWPEHYFLIPVREYQPLSGPVYSGSRDMAVRLRTGRAAGHRDHPAGGRDEHAV